MTKLPKILDISNSEMPKSVERMSAPLTIVQGIDTTVKTTTTVEKFLKTLQRTDEEAMAKRESAGGARHVPESMVERIE